MGHAGHFPPSEIPQPSVAPAPHTSLSKQALRKTRLKALQPPPMKRRVDCQLHSPRRSCLEIQMPRSRWQILTSWVQSGQRESENRVSQSESGSEPEWLAVVMQRLAPVKPAADVLRSKGGFTCLPRRLIPRPRDPPGLPPSSFLQVWGWGWGWGFSSQIEKG